MQAIDSSGGGPSADAPLSTDALLALDARHVWHPYTQHLHAPAPLPIVRAEVLRVRMPHVPRVEREQVGLRDRFAVHVWHHLVEARGVTTVGECVLTENTEGFTENAERASGRSPCSL